MTDLVLWVALVAGVYAAVVVALVAGVLVAVVVVAMRHHKSRFLVRPRN